MVSYLYYRRGDEWVRVNADSYEQITESGPPPSPTGNCSTKYRVFATYTVTSRSGKYLHTREDWPISSTVPGPVTGVAIENEGRIVAVYNANGLYAGRSVSSGSVRASELLGVKHTRIDGLPDDCPPPGNGGDSGECSTVFSLEGSEVLTLDHCPEITENSCRDCCSELLNLARRIRV